MSETDKMVSRPDTEPKPEIAIDARELFRGRREVLIDLEGAVYRLRITRRNKLILQK